MPGYGLSVGVLRSLFEDSTAGKKGVERLQKEFGGVEGVAQKIEANLQDGLKNDPKDLAARADAFGANRMPEKEPPNFWAMVLEALSDVTLIILIVSGAISLVLGLTVEEDKSTGWIEGASILGAVAIVVLVTAINDYQKEQQFRQLNAVKDDVMVNVIRDGHPQQVSVFDVVVGDILSLSQGDNVCADGLVVSGHDLKINESALTGESDDIKKDPVNAPFVYSGTQVMEGYGHLLVVAVGVNSQQGIITSLIHGSGGKKRAAGSVGVPDESTPLLEDGAQDDLEEVVTHGADDDDEDQLGGSVLQAKLERLAVQIGYCGMVMAALTVAVLVTRFCITTYSHRGWEANDITILLKHFITGVTVLVVAVPEGLPLAVTIALAFSVKKMLKDNNLVRHLDACETMGNATTICSDKTGTLTTNRMTVVRGFVGWTRFDQTATYADSGISDIVTDALMEGIAVNSTAEVVPAKEQGGLPEQIGSKTECALLQLLVDQGRNYHAIRKEREVVKLVPFNSARKRMSCVIKRDGQGGSSFRLHMKGASEIMLEHCSKYIKKNGELGDFAEIVKLHLLSHIQEFAQDGLRTLVLAYKDFTDAPADWEEADPEELEKDLVCLGIVGIQDPVRPEVPAAIRACKSAGIVVRMVTGDNVVTAKAIAAECGILSSSAGDSVIEGPVFRKRVLDEDGNIIMSEFDRIWPSLRVMARSSPTDKYTLVTGLLMSSAGEKQVVAVTGDGTNDAPALKRADVGFAMGIQGTSVSKDASDIILMDDNFNSIVKAVMWGRNVYDSVSKFLQFQLTVNVVAILLAFLGACIINESPITSVQMLWVNLIMDTFASLALATEPPTDALLQRKPYSRDKPIITRHMLRFILGHAVYQCVIIFTLIFKGPEIFGFEPHHVGYDNAPSIHYTFVFHAFVVCQLFNEINARKIHGEWNVFAGLFSNPLYLAIMLFQIVVQSLIVQFGGRVFSCAPLPLHLHGWCLLFGFGELIWNRVLLSLSYIFHIPKAWETRGDVDFDTKPLSEGRAVWLRSIQRVRSQVRVANRFKESRQSSDGQQARDGILKLKSHTVKHVRQTPAAQPMRRTFST